MAYRDSSGKQLSDYQRPSVAVDTAVLTVRTSGPAAELCVGLLDDPRATKRRLPGTFLREGERLADAVRRSLADKAGITGLEPAQLHVFDDPRRDSRGWVLSVAHLAVVPPDRFGSLDPVPVTRAVGLDFDHDEIVRLAVDRLRADYADRPDPAGLLDDPFTLAELRSVHAAIAAKPLQADTFRRLMVQHLEPTGELQRGTVGKPAQLYRRPAGPARS